MMQIQRGIEAAFDGVHADEVLKERTRRAVMQAAQNEARPRRLVKRGVTFAICAAAVVCVIFFGANAYFTPTSTISIDINPSIEMDVNRFDRVIDVRGYNDDGVEFASTLDVVNESYEDAIYEVLDSESVSDRLKADGVLSIAVIQSDEDQGEEIMGFIDQCTQGRGNIECYCMNAEDVSDAHSLGLSYGRYKYYLQIHEYDATVTPEQKYANCSMSSVEANRRRRTRTEAAARRAWVMGTSTEKIKRIKLKNPPDDSSSGGSTYLYAGVEH